MLYGVSGGCMDVSEKFLIDGICVCVMLNLMRIDVLIVVSSDEMCDVIKVVITFFAILDVVVISSGLVM